MINFNLSLQVIFITFLLSLTSLIDITKVNIHIKKFIYLIISIFLFYFTAFREWGGSDYHIYEQYFQNPEDFFINYGIGYEILTKTFLALNLNYRDFIIATSLFTTFIQLWFIQKYSRHSLISLLWYFSSGFIWINHILIRQSIAISFCLIFIHLLIKNYSKLKFLPLLLGISFHGSSIFYASFLKFKKKYIFLITILLFAFFILAFFFTYSKIIDIFSPNLLVYILQPQNEGFSKALVLEFILLTIVIIKNKKLYLDKKNEINYSLFVILLLVVLSFISLVPASARVLDLFKIISAVILVNFISEMKLLNRCPLFLLLIIISIFRIISFLNTFDGGLWDI